MEGDTHRPKTTTMGTRVIIRQDGSWIQLIKPDDGLGSILTVHDEETKRINLRLSQRECLTLIEYLAVAATLNSEKEVFDMVDDGTNTTAIVVLPEETDR